MSATSTRGRNPIVVGCFPAVAALALFAGCSGGNVLEQASRALERGEYQQAFAAITQASVDSDSFEVQRLLARACLHTMRTSQGIGAAERAIERNPADAESHFLKALLLQRAFRTGDARAAAARAVELAPDEPRYRIALGEALLGGGTSATSDYGMAAVQFQRARSLDPSNNRARLGLGKSLVLSGEHEEGMVELDGVLQELESAEARYLRGVAKMRRREFGVAETDFRVAIRVAPEMPGPYFNLARVLRMSGRTEEAEAIGERFQTVHALDNHAKKLKLTYHTESGDLPGGLELAKLLAATSEFEDGITLLESLCVDRPKAPRPHLILAEVAIEHGWLETAAWAAERALEITPGRAEAHHLMALVESNLKRAQSALPYAREAVRLGPKVLKYRLTLGDALHEAGEFEEAAKVFEEARRLVPGNPRALAGLGKALAASGFAEEGERALSEALTRRPRQHEWFCARGELRLAEKKLGRAEDDFRQAMMLAPNYSPAYDGLARALRERGRIQEAGEMQEKGREARRREEEIRRLQSRSERHRLEPAEAEELALLFDQSGLEVEATRVRARASAFGVEP